MNGKKTVFLFLALLLPVGVFLFLKFFGKNRFDVPVLFESELPAATHACGVHYTLPYRVPDSVAAPLFQANDPGLILLSFSPEREYQARLTSEMAAGDLKIIQATDTVFRAMDFNFVRNCIFLLDAPFDLVLLDRQRRIRGQYTAADRDEVDRLIVELKIILEKY
jgi:hypothetical protein